FLVPCSSSFLLSFFSSSLTSQSIMFPFVKGERTEKRRRRKDEQGTRNNEQGTRSGRHSLILVVFPVEKNRHVG
ncbi:MAG TPA: hypothetical protein VM223_27225, partial [Planctomycetota bacterium]|nr:hypothetical protein [Planctomycetota bacterium]